MDSGSRLLFWTTGSLLLLSLAVNVYISLEFGRHHRILDELTDSVAAIAMQRDTLQSINRSLAARRDSTSALRSRLTSLEMRLAACSLEATYPGYYLIINTAENNFQLRYGDMLVRTGYCGTGKGWSANDSGLVWDFSTPRGLRYVEKKGTNPYWYRPDWYWLEQNLRPPRPDQVVVIPETLSYDQQIVYYRDSLTASERVWVAQVPGALGSYKIDLGGGVLLHYGTGLGRNVSHGCVRLSGSDLEALYRALPVGAPVLIY
ncbi:L,D-transpeptidase [Candidatus Fermentibacterales bacterium]|nr:L,D-transpeptidase [Candidatus Fermentibacterales bacterium]